MKALKFLIIALMVVQLFALASALNVKSVSTNPAEVAPGQSVELKIVMDNNLGYDVENVEMSLDLSKIPFAPEQSSVQFKDRIDDGDDGAFVFNLISGADTIAGAYDVPVEVDYKKVGENTTQSKKFSVSIIVNAKPELNLNSDNFLVENQKGKLEVKITNVGLSKAKFLEVELQNSGSYDVLSSNKIYIGDLESNDFDTASFDTLVRVPGNVFFPIVLRYRDARNNQITETKSVTVKSYTQEDAQKLGLVQKNNTFFYISIVVILLILWWVWRKIKKRKKS